MYDLLAGVRVLEVSVLAPNMAGMNLADLGADVIKVELPPYGDHTRNAPPYMKDNKTSLAHLKWNRGKRSIMVDLKTPEGVSLFKELVKEVDVVLEGLRAGAMEGYGVGYETLREINPALVYTAISGTGQTGPYARLGMHAVTLDAFAGTVPVRFRESDGAPYIGKHVAFGSRVGPLYAAYATAAALVKAARSGKGSYIDVGEIDASVFANADPLLSYTSTGSEMPDDVFKDFARYQIYGTKDDKYVLLQPLMQKFWVNFCNGIGRPEMIPLGGGSSDPLSQDKTFENGNEPLRAELTKVMKEKTKAEWVQFFIDHNIVGGPVNTTMEELVEDPHFIARGNVYEHHHPTAGTLTMPGTPIKVKDAEFGPLHAPSAGEHTDAVLGELLKMDAARLADLRERGVVA